MFSFPDVVDDITVRLVAAQVLLVTTLSALTGWWWLFALLALDFALRVSFGPRSPLAQVALKVLRPLVSAAPRPTSGPPKRFAAAIGLVCSVAVVAFSLLGWSAAAWIVVAMMIVFPFLEAAFGLCVGCKAFAALMRLGVIPQDVCEDCADITRRLRAPAV